MNHISVHIKTISNRIVVFLLSVFIFASISAQTKRALVIGISDYPKIGENAWGAIHGANDAELMTPVLNKQGFKTVKICDKEATAKRIRNELNNLVSSSRAGDIVYIHFSCHGQPYEDLNGDEEDGWDESLVPYDAIKVYEKRKYEGTNHITDDELSTYLLRLRRAVGVKGFVSVVIDACHAGGASRGEEESDDEDSEIFVRGTKKAFSPNGKVFRPRINTKGHFKISQAPKLSDIIVLEACRSYQSNYEIKQSGHYYGPLSYYVSQVLAYKAVSADIEWVLEVKRKMDERLTRQNMVYESSLK